MTVRARANNLKHLFEFEFAHGNNFTLKQCLKLRRHLGRPLKEISQCPFFDLAILSIRLPQQNRGRRVSIGDTLNIREPSYQLAKI
jgi:hypothetical protein